ncbi:hypothetical protein K438DRAFT_1968938 [Mycena galopus ATCC 62051]|nr:hypothetical protein K438DRAFT_1968938 [Mycena galopus ATCC 62051]
MSRPTFSFTTTAEEVATAFADIIRRKNVLITGTSLNRIGFETARVLAMYANLVIITGHNPNRLKLAEETIMKEVPSAKIRPLVLDLSSLSSVREAASEVNAIPDPLHVLIHDAAAAVGPFKLTVDNLESQVATDHISPFLLTKLLAPKLLSARTEFYTPRVVFVSSVGHGLGTGVNFETLGRPDPTRYEPMETYFQAKAANVISAIELSKRSKGQINAYSLHPGAIYTNIFQKGDAVAELQKIGYLDSDGQPSSSKAYKTMAQGAATTMVAAFDPRLNCGFNFALKSFIILFVVHPDTPGAYLDDCIAVNELVAQHCSDLVSPTSC